MITPDDVPHLASRSYQRMLTTWLRGEPYTPVHWKVGSLPVSLSERHAVCLVIAQGAKVPGAYGYSVQWQPHRTRANVVHDLPQTLYAETCEDLLMLADKRAEFARFQVDVAIIRAQFPAMEAWIQAHPQKVVAYGGEWEPITRVIAYLYTHPWPAIEIRALPVSVDTKFIERHTGILRDILDAILPPEAIDQEAPDFAQRYGFLMVPQLVRIRGLDHQFSQQYRFPSEDIMMPLTDAMLLQLHARMAIVVENLHALLALPPCANTIAVWGSGFAARTLVTMPWLQTMRVLYWGDLDAQGFEILSQVRTVLPHTESLLMEESLLDILSEFTVPGTSSSLKSLPQLTQAEYATYRRLAQNAHRLEQERIPRTHLSQRLIEAWS